MKLELSELKYPKDALVPAMSEISVGFHHDVLAKGYVDRFNSSQGDTEFNLAGAKLHGLLFEQYKSYQSDNEITGAVKDLILENFAGIGEFQRIFLRKCLELQGSGWIYLSKSGKIKKIKNHKNKDDVVFLIDMWEHSWMMDYRTDKAGYVNNCWFIMDWDVVNKRIMAE